MKYLGRAYEKANVFPGDIITIKNSIVYGSNEYIVIDPKEHARKNSKLNVDKYVYFKLKLFIDGMPPERIIKIKNINSCSECNIQGEYINGAFKCPKCWKVWY